MTVDDLINSAFKERGGVLDASNFYALAGDVNTKELFTLNLQDFFIDNLEHFRTGEHTGVILVGAYSSESAARAARDTVQGNEVHGDGLLAGDGWHVLIGNATENKLFVLPLKEYYIGYFAFYLFKVDSGNVVISIFNKKEAAEDAIDLIRYSIRAENSAG